jgi:Kef-type K+ transport system membrane component KefB
MNWFFGIPHYPFYEFAIILALATILGGIGQLFKQPLIVMFIALGIIVSPTVLDVIQSPKKIHLLAEIGISVLLFIVGLKLDFRIIKSVGKTALLVGMGQVFFTSLVGYFIGLLLGFTSLHSLYIAVALTFSSTIIIVKLLSDKKEIDSLHGQIAIGVLIVQDIVVILMMRVLSAFQKETDASLSQDILLTFVAGLGLLGFTFLAMKWLIPALSAFLAKSQELLTLFAIAWAVTLASTGELIGFSSEVGAFLAGMSLASSNFKDLISSRLTTLRDFLLLFFFVNLGSNLDLSIIGSQLYSAITFSLFVLVGNPLIVLIIMGVMGYRKRTSFLTGLTVAQISEFSLIFAGLGFAVGHINNEVVGLITLVGLITIGLSTYLILYSSQIYELLSPMLNIFQRKKAYTEMESIQDKHKQYDVLIIGIGRFGRRLSEMLDAHPGITYLGVDFDPGVIREWKDKGKDILYGDMEDPDLLEQIPYDKSKVIISSVANNELSHQLKQILERNHYRGNYFVTAPTEKDYNLLRENGLQDQNILQPQQMAAMNFYESFLLKNVT